MEKAESKNQFKVIGSARDLSLKNAILDMLSSAGERGMDAFALLEHISRYKIKLEYKGLLYRCLLMLVRSSKVERFYSYQRGKIVYRIRKR
jgi:hypothetical protein